MAHLGWLLLVAGATAAVVAVLTGRRTALHAAAALLGGSAAVLGWALLTSDFTFAYVAGQSRRDASAWYRLAGLWGGPEGSLLTFTLLTALAASAAPASLGRREPAESVDATEAAGVVTAAGGTVAAADAMAAGRAGDGAAVVRLGAVPVAVLAAATALLADPFERLAAPAVDGAGLTPILEHPAMAVHPPLLYAGLVATLSAFALAAVGLARAGADGRRWPAVRRCLLVAVALLTGAMALGGLWSYVEAGWGGYWAWDPVENTSMAPWLAALVAIHLGKAGRIRAALALATVPWILVLAGAAITRSGATPSVHAFSESDRLGLVLSVVTLATAALAAGSLLVGRRRAAESAAAGDMPVASVGAALLGAGAVILVIGTAAPVVRRLAGDPGTAVGGWFFADLLAPLALVGAGALGGIAVRGRRVALLVAVTLAVVVAVAAWTADWPVGSVVLAALGAFVLIAAVAALVAGRSPAWLAHGGLGLLLVGVGGTAATIERTVPLDRGEVLQVAGVTVTNLGVEVAEGPRVGTQAVVATLALRDGGREREVAPSLVAYPERGGVLAETARWSRPWHDVQVVLVRADDDQQALVTIRVRPLVALVWLGALAIVAGSLGSLLGRRQRARRPVVLISRSGT